MPIATTVTAAATTLAALAAAVGTIVALYTCRRARQAPAQKPEPPPTMPAGAPGTPGVACPADLVALLCAMGCLVLIESLAAADAGGSETADLAALLDEILTAAAAARSAR